MLDSIKIRNTSLEKESADLKSVVELVTKSLKEHTATLEELKKDNANLINNDWKKKYNDLLELSEIPESYTLTLQNMEYGKVPNGFDFITDIYKNILIELGCVNISEMQFQNENVIRYIFNHPKIDILKLLNKFSEFRDTEIVGFDVD